MPWSLTSSKLLLRRCLDDVTKVLHGVSSISLSLSPRAPSISVFNFSFFLIN